MPPATNAHTTPVFRVANVRARIKTSGPWVEDVGAHARGTVEEPQLIPKPRDILTYRSLIAYGTWLNTNERRRLMVGPLQTFYAKVPPSHTHADEC